jgi:hypothetical protein
MIDIEDRTPKRGWLMQVRAALTNVVTGLITAASAALILSATCAHGQEVKVGVQLPYTGVGAENVQQIDRGLGLYLKLNPDKAKPYTIKLIRRDAKDVGGKIVEWRALRESNPCFRRERAAS